MSQINSVIIEGKFQHFTSKKGALPLRFVLENNKAGTKKDFVISIESEKMADIFINQKKDTVRVVGYLGKNSKSTIIVAEHIECK